jgi:hypothetical protein
MASLERKDKQRGVDKSGQKPGAKEEIPPMPVNTCSPGRTKLYREEGGGVKPLSFASQTLSSLAFL